MCQERGKTWEGGDPICSFPDGGEFSSAGWNCATANAVRSLFGDGWKPPTNPKINFQHCDDQKFGVINVDEVDMPSGRNVEALWVGWYKRRGRTEAMWLLGYSAAPRRPTEADCLSIVEAFKADIEE